MNVVINYKTFVYNLLLLILVYEEEIRRLVLCKASDRYIVKPRERINTNDPSQGETVYRPKSRGDLHSESSSVQILSVRPKKCKAYSRTLNGGERMFGKHLFTCSPESILSMHTHALRDSSDRFMLDFH